jgi:hypothetical protein
LKNNDDKSTAKPIKGKSALRADNAVDLQDIVDSCFTKTRRNEVTRKVCPELSDDDIIFDEVWLIVENSLKHHYLERARQILDELNSTHDPFRERDIRFKALWEDISLASSGLMLLKGQVERAAPSSEVTSMTVDELAPFHRAVIATKCMEVVNLLIGYSLFEVGQQYVALSISDITDESLRSLKKSWSLKLSKEVLLVAIKLLVTIATPSTTVWNFVELVENEATNPLNLNMRKKEDFKNAKKLASISERYRKCLSAALEQEENLFKTMRFTIQLKLRTLIGTCVFFLDDHTKIEADGPEASLVRRMTSCLMRNPEDATALHRLFQSVISHSPEESIAGEPEARRRSLLLELKSYARSNV